MDEQLTMALQLDLPDSEETIGMNRIQELENALDSLINLFDSDDLIMNPDLEVDEQEMVQEVLDRSEATLSYEED